MLANMRMIAIQHTQPNQWVLMKDKQGNVTGFPKAATDRSVTEITWSKYDEESYATQVYLLPFLEPA